MLDFGFYNMDCMDGMREFPDDYFELAIVDPPYGIERLKRNDNKKSLRTPRYGNAIKANNSVPDDNYFNELFRVSKNQIIWGGNYFALKRCRCFICWYKHQPVPQYSDAEYAWTSFNQPAKVFDFKYFGNIGADEYRFHPTQKPVALYRWLLEHYAKEGDKILDTHVGSASSLIACREMGFKYVGFEIDEDYFKMAKKRLDQAENQVNIFDLL